MYKHILLPLDLDNQDALPRVFDTALRLLNADGKISLISVNSVTVHPAMMSYVSDEKLEEIRQQMKATLRELQQQYLQESQCGHTLVREGVVYDTVLYEARKRDVDLIVLPASRPGAVTYLIGSNASKIVRHSACSVMVLR